MRQAIKLRMQPGDTRPRPGLWLGALALLGLGACAPGPGGCDPTQTTFISGIACSASGGYTERQQVLTTESSQAQGRAVEAREAATGAEIRRDQSRAQLASTERRVRQQNAELTTLRQRLDRARAERGAASAQVREAEAALAEAERIRAAGGRSAGDLAARDAAQRRAQQNIDALIGF
jgi:chromosome segregation ATPase